MDASEVTAFRLAGYSETPQNPASSFHGLSVKESHALREPRRTQLITFLQAVARREDREEGTSGGPWGCISGSRGLRFAGPAGTFDFIVECELWIRPPDQWARTSDQPADTTIVFTEQEGKLFESIFEPVFEKGP